MVKPILNKVRCKKCNDVIESKHTHDFRRCRCGAIAIDGGTDYQRFTWGGDQPPMTPNLKLEDYIDDSLSVYED